jgi:type II secretory pathway pseudopilin PulG
MRSLLASFRRPTRRFRRSRRAVTDIPLELLIIVVILAIVLPILVISLINYGSYQSFSNVEQQANVIRDTAIQVMDSGFNTTILLTVTVSGSYNPYLVIGANLMPNGYGGFVNYQAAYVTYGLGSGSGTGNQSTLVSNGAGVVLLTNVTCTGNSYQTWTYHPFPLHSGNYQVSLTKEAPGAYYCGSWLPASFPSFVEVQLAP